MPLTKQGLGPHFLSPSHRKRSTAIFADVNSLLTGMAEIRPPVEAKTWPKKKTVVRLQTQGIEKCPRERQTGFVRRPSPFEAKIEHPKALNDSHSSSFVWLLAGGQRLGLIAQVPNRSLAPPSAENLLPLTNALSETEQLRLAALIIEKVQAPALDEKPLRLEPTNKEPNLRKLEMHWLDDHRQEYAGQWVVIEQDRLIASGKKASEVFRAAKQAGIEFPFLVQVEAKDQLPFGGW